LWQDLLDEHDEGDRDGPRDAHRANADEYGHERPAASEAVKTVL
jgi:hypothetical protein